MSLIYKTIFLLLFLDLLILISGSRILIYEKKINKGEIYIIEEYGNLGEGSSSLHCKYFTGRSIIDIAYYYAPNNFFGKDSCPFYERHWLILETKKKE